MAIASGGPRGKAIGLNAHCPGGLIIQEWSVACPNARVSDHSRSGCVGWLFGLRLIKIALVGLTTCGLGWVWLAMYLYYERFKQRRLPASGQQRR